MTFKDFRDPIEYVIEQYFQKKRGLKSNKPDQKGKEQKGNYKRSYMRLPQLPMRVLKNREGKKYKFVYGDLKALEENPNADVVIWQEELLFDAAGKCNGIKKTYPDGREVISMMEEVNGEFVGFGLE